MVSRQLQMLLLKLVWIGFARDTDLHVLKVIHGHYAVHTNTYMHNQRKSRDDKMESQQD